MDGLEIVSEEQQENEHDNRSINATSRRASEAKHSSMPMYTPQKKSYIQTPNNKELSTGKNSPNPMINMKEMAD